MPPTSRWDPFLVGRKVPLPSGQKFYVQKSPPLLRSQPGLHPGQQLAWASSRSTLSRFPQVAIYTENHPISPRRTSSVGEKMHVRACVTCPAGLLPRRHGSHPHCPSCVHCPLTVTSHTPPACGAPSQRHRCWWGAPRNPALVPENPAQPSSPRFFKAASSRHQSSRDSPAEDWDLFNRPGLRTASSSRGCARAHLDLRLFTLLRGSTCGSHGLPHGGLCATLPARSPAVSPVSGAGGRAEHMRRGVHQTRGPASPEAVCPGRPVSLAGTPVRPPRAPSTAPCADSHAEPRQDHRLLPRGGCPHQLWSHLMARPEP